jgi:hypothetical protein
MQENPYSVTAQKIMTEFAAQTGLFPLNKSPRRYLWTDAFAVCNFLELYARTGDDAYRKLALQLVDQVHTMLGRHRQDDTRTGWLSGFEEQEGALHPTSGGLRIGKKINERDPHESYDQNQEWDRDGQYYHYLTKWMHALDCVSKVTSDPIFNIWARELAKAIHPKFVFTPSSGGLKGGQKCIFWKMSIDLTYPLVSSMGQHDPLDGFITLSRLKANASDNSKEHPGLNLDNEILELEEICKDKSWATNDPLGLGGLLCNAYQMAQLITGGNLKNSDLLEALLTTSIEGLDSQAAMKTFMLPADYRLAFRELGLTIGLHALERLKELIENNKDYFDNHDSLSAHVNKLMEFKPLIEKIENFWLENASQQTETWIEHKDINMVMLATSLAPDGFL